LDYCIPLEAFQSLAHFKHITLSLKHEERG
jgi:hypothetical protein